MTCPQCGLENPSRALKCDCGYSFNTGNNNNRENNHDIIRETGFRSSDPAGKGDSPPVDQEKLARARQEVLSRKKKIGYFEVIGGILLIIIGIIVTLNSPQTIFYGLVWIGCELIFLGIIAINKGKSWEDLSSGMKILISIGSLAIAVIFLVITSGIIEF